MKLSDILKQSGGDAEKGVELLLKASGSSSSPCSPILARLYNAGYKAGHHDTVEGQYTDIFEEDMDSFHDDEVAEFLEENARDEARNEA